MKSTGTTRLSRLGEDEYTSSTLNNGKWEKTDPSMSHDVTEIPDSDDAELAKMGYKAECELLRLAPADSMLKYWDSFQLNENSQTWAQYPSHFRSWVFVVPSLQLYASSAS